MLQTPHPSPDRLLYRVTKGHAVLKTDSVKDLDDKTVFRILYSSFEMQSRILKLIQSNGSTIYLVRPLSSYSGNSEPRLDGIHVLPSSPSAFGELQRKVYDDTSEREKLIHSTSSQVTELLTSLARVHRERRHYVVKEKALFHCLNMMKIDKGASFATAVAWIPSRFVPKVRAVVEAQHLCGLGKETLDVTEADVPPTYFETNDFTGTFQGIIDSYGVPRYREINPVAFTIVTFPWLFGLMYGDVGHGLMIVLGSVVMIYNQQTMKSMNLNEIVDMIFGARWLLLLMGLFATYIGLLYNDTFAMMFEYSESRFLFPDGWTEAGAGKDTCFYQGGSSTGLLPLLCAPCSINELVMVTMGDGSQRCTCPFAYVLPSALMASEYSCPNFVNGTGPLASTNFMAPSNGPTPFGMDAAWHEADNKLTFMNSFKMKNAVIVGVLQMSLGLFLSLGNHLHFGDWKRIYFGFIPECMFLFCTFGYMCVMLIAKWLTPWPNTSIAPNVLESMTNFFLSPGHYNLYSDEKCAAGDCSGYVYLYSAQMEVQVVLIIIAFAAVPLMLIPIPVLKGRENARIEKRAMMMGEEPVGLVDMQEVWIKQVIHTIEFVLGCVSNTASYLRLWALSLAHAELSEVFWSFAIMKMLDGADDVSGGVIMYLGFGAWLSATIGVLIIMEALSAFLHSLRLHWVEYQTKFYVGDGRKFTPLNFAELVAESDVQTS
ncbi:putative V-type proton ATPase 116 kDa subunit a [Diplonema papillatum]|nr:putative V-type proton ATPase 116 kDa subunit a [Diplonema papillatum]